MPTNRDLSILSLGFTRDLWESPEAASGDTFARLTAYSQYLKTYQVLVHSSKRHNLKTPLKLAGNFVAHSTNGYTPIDSWIRMVRLGRQISRKHSINVIQAQDPLFTGTVARLLGRQLKIPYNICVYGTNPFDENWVATSRPNALGAGVARAVLFAADGVQVDGTATKRSLVRAGIEERRIAVKPMLPRNINDFVNAETDPQLRHTLSDAGRYSWLVLFVGRVVAQKNLQLLLKVAHAVTAHARDVRFICVGDGPERSSLEAETRRLGLADTVLWLGAKPHAEIVKYMATCDLFLLSSRYEGFARVLMEAAAAGTPIITTAVSGADDGVIDGKTGYIVPIDDADALVSAVQKLMANPSLGIQMGQESRRHLQSLVEHFMNPYLQVEIWRRIAAARQN